VGEKKEKVLRDGDFFFCSLNIDVPGVHLAMEIDCVRIYTQSKQEILQRVPNITVQLFKIGSMSPGAILMEASREFEVSTVSRVLFCLISSTPVHTDYRCVCQKKVSELGKGNIFDGCRALTVQLEKKKKAYWNRPHTCYR
jgi:hypothetical protein